MLSFFKDLFTHFHDFWSQIGVVILVTPKQEVERKSEWFCGVKFFRSKFKVEWENWVWTKIGFLASGFLYAAISLWFLLFFRFFGSDLILNGFPNPFIVRFRSSFLFSQWKFFELYVRTCPAMFFVSSSEALFSFYICSDSKAEKVKYSEWLLPLTNSVCARDVISHSL